MRIAALDPAAPYRAALTDAQVGLPNAQLVLDHFHVHKLANAAIDDVRRRVQQETALAAGDPYEEVDCTHMAKNCSAASTRHPTASPPEVTRLATTIDR